jgi:predicted flap endonuclease-1-like 5' DNA nuclease
MAEKLNRDLDQAQAELVKMRSDMAAEVAVFRTNTQMANQAMAAELWTKLGTERATLAAEMDETLAAIDAFLGEVRADNAGAAAAWRTVKEAMKPVQPEAQPPAPVKAKVEPPVKAPEAKPAAPPPPAEDALVDIHGIGPSTQSKLHAAGVKTFAQLAATAPETLREIVGPFVARMARVEEWIEEARHRMM